MKLKKLLRKLDIAFEDAEQGQDKFLKKLAKFEKELGEDTFRDALQEYKDSIEG